MATNTSEGVMLNGEELVEIVREMDVKLNSITVDELDDTDFFARPWLVKYYGVKTYALTIEHDYDEDSPFSDPDYWQDAIAEFVAENHPEVLVEEDGWLPNVVFHV